MPAATGSAPASKGAGSWLLATHGQVHSCGCHHGSRASLIALLLQGTGRGFRGWHMARRGEHGWSAPSCRQSAPSCRQWFTFTTCSQQQSSPHPCSLYQSRGCAPRILSMPPLPETGQRPLRPLGRARAICATGRAAGPSLHKLHEFKADEAGSASADAL